MSAKNIGNAVVAPEESEQVQPTSFSAGDGDLESEQMKQNGRAQLFGALEGIHESEKAAYLEAVKKCPQLIETESDPIRFLRYESYNAWTAAQRLVSYWETRKSIFGERAYLPLDLSGTGALCHEDIEYLATGLYAILPSDSKGRPVLCTDRSRVSGANSPETKARSLFYLFHLLSLNANAQVNGFVALVHINISTPANIDYGTLPTGLHLVKNVFPLKLCKCHLVSCPPKSGRRTLIETIIPVTLKRLGSWLKGFTEVHMFASKSEASEKLQAIGLVSGGIPSTFGGTWTYENEFKNWFEQLKESSTSAVKIASDFATHESEDAAKDDTQPLSDGSSKRHNHDDERMRLIERVLAAVSQKSGGDDENRDSDANPTETPSTLERAEAELEKAMSLIKDNEKAAYLEALERAPLLFETECSPVIFLRHEKFDAWAAARRLAAYWEKRKSLFGDRAFLPMTLTGHGALSEDDLVLLGTAYVAVLPDDVAGNPVMLLDWSRLPAGALGPSRIRCFIYTLHVILEKMEKTRADGMRVIFVANDPYLIKFRSIDGSVNDFAEKVMPIHLHGLHIVYCKSGPIKKTLTDMVKPLAAKIIGGFVSKRTHTHIAESQEEAIKQLQTCGFARDGLPQTIGGTWSYQNFVPYWSERVRIERQKYKGIFGDLKPEAAAQLPLTESVAKLPRESAEDKRRRKRKMRVIYSRNKRERQKQRNRSLEQEYSDLQLENRSLKAENNRLENLVEAAKQEVDLHEQSIDLKMPVLAQAPIQRSSVPPFVGTQLGSVSHLVQSQTLSQVGMAQSQTLSQVGMPQSMLSPSFRHMDTLSSDGERLAALFGLQLGQHQGLSAQPFQPQGHLHGALQPLQLDLQLLRYQEDRSNLPGASMSLAELTRIQPSSDCGGGAVESKNARGQFVRR